MDWIEGAAVRLRDKLGKAGLCTGLLWTMAAWLVAAVMVYIIVRNVCGGWISVMGERYDMSEIYGEGARGGFEVSTEARAERPTAAAEAAGRVLYFLYSDSLIFFAAVMEYVGVRLFFRKRVAPGLEAADRAVGYLAVGDLGHEQSYSDGGELGSLCDGLEALRKSLTDSKRHEWELQEEQASINSAFAHDLRTPLTVMKGYTEFLLKYEPQGKVSREMLREKLEVMLRHQERLIEFSKTMAQIQSMDMLELKCRRVSYGEVVGRLRESLGVTGRQSLGVTGRQSLGQTGRQNEEAIRVSLQDVFCGEDGSGERGNGDAEILVHENLVYEVAENLVSNAMRYAKSAVTVTVDLKRGENGSGDRLLLYVQDDGQGFSPAAMKGAKKLYFSEEKGESNHFGMGLYISERLCSKHGGRLNVFNSTEGGGIAAAEFKVGR